MTEFFRCRSDATPCRITSLNGAGDSERKSVMRFLSQSGAGIMGIGFSRAMAVKSYTCAESVSTPSHKSRPK
jgi:hypothetical protein